ncbi:MULTISPECIES: SDR family oxidoreductase [Pseudonocardia]|uniref:SDR family oxidoreductase n=1 Tax=Pseudonocardia TaxID=1847 RepID=UPI001AD78AA2|nr:MULTISPECIES: SDR family oxidoreductase [Pseudonocardia]MBO4236188.1 SDR family NAD(P)-dependent oxidoreductase [Pseudonocardia alni]
MTTARTPTTTDDRADGTADGTALGTVLVTGGASGLGAAVVDAVLAAGGTPQVLDLHPPKADVAHVTVDLADTAATEAAVTELARLAGPPDAVVTAAGIDRPAPFGTLPSADWERVVRVNLFGTAAVLRATLPQLELVGGRVVTIASTLGLKAVPDATAYCASKFGVLGFSRALAAETAGRVRVTTLVPGGMHTAFFDDRDEQYRPPEGAALNRPQDTAATVLYALRQPPGCEVRELVVCHSEEGSWP